MLRVCKFETNKIQNRKTHTFNTESDLVISLKSQSGEKSSLTKSKNSLTPDTCLRTFQKLNWGSRANFLWMKTQKDHFLLSFQLPVLASSLVCASPLVFILITLFPLPTYTVKIKYDSWGILQQSTFIDTVFYWFLLNLPEFQVHLTLKRWFVSPVSSSLMAQENRVCHTQWYLRFDKTQHDFIGSSQHLWGNLTSSTSQMRTLICPRTQDGKAAGPETPGSRALKKSLNFPGYHIVFLQQG